MPRTLKCTTSDSSVTFYESNEFLYLPCPLLFLLIASACGTNLIIAQGKMVRRSEMMTCTGYYGHQSNPFS